MSNELKIYNINGDMLKCLYTKVSLSNPGMDDKTDSPLNTCVVKFKDTEHESSLQTNPHASVLTIKN